MEKEETKNIDKSAEEKLKKTDNEEVNLEDHKNETEEKVCGRANQSLGTIAICKVKILSLEICSRKL